MKENHMNIFVLHKNPKVAAIYHLDKHVVKMPTEAYQMLSTNLRLALGVPGKLLITKPFKTNPHMDKKGKIVYDIVYKDVMIDYSHCLLQEIGRRPIIALKAFENHPCTIWTRQNNNNFTWLLKYAFELLEEYKHRYGKEKTHGSLAGIQKCHLIFSYNDCFPSGDLTEFPLAMPDKYKIQGDPVTSYRNYYNCEKAYIGHYTNRTVPSWFKVDPF